MELTNEFRVAVSPERTWEVLTDVERIAPCMPGAELLSVDGEEYHGAVKVKVGPITAQYKGKAHFVEKDQADWRAVIRAEGKESRGQGNAAATITATLTPDGEGTRVVVVTDLQISGKAAQFGRGVLAEVSGKLLKQFVQCLERDLLAPAGSLKVASPVGLQPDAATDVPVPPTAQRPSPTGAAAQPLDLFGSVAAPLVKRIGPPLVALAVIALVVRQRRRRRLA